MKLTSVDWLIMLLYFVFVLGIGFALKRYMKTSKDFFQAGRALPAWICGLAFISANLGAQEVIGMGASGAKYGLETAHFYGIGAIPAMIFVGIFMMPFYYGSKARSVSEFLRMRFDEKTRALNACSFAVMTVFSSGISMYAMARLIQVLHVFDGLFHALGWAPEGIFTFSIVLSGMIVLAYIFLGGLTSAIYNEVLQFFLIIAGFLPLVLIGLRNIGGWAGLKASVPAEQQQGRWQDSAPTLEKCVAMKPTLSKARYRLALAYSRLGQKVRAKEQFALQQKYSQQEKDEVNAKLQEVTTFLVTSPPN